MAVMQTAEGDPGHIHRCMTGGQLDVDPCQSAIVIHYQMEAVVLSEYGEPIVAERKECKKTLKVPNLGRNTDIQHLAWDIVSKCDLILPARLPEVEQLLSYLQNRNEAQKRNGVNKDNDVLENSSRKIQEQIEDLQSPTEKASIDELDAYLESLYDNLQAKIRGTGLILQLARSPDNLLDLMGNDSLFLALARVLKEDWKKSIELATNIIYIFFCFSTFSIFHKMLAQHKIGSTCMAVIEHEIKRHKSLLEDLAVKKKNCKSEEGGSVAKAKKEYDKGRKKYQQLLKKQETLLRVTLYLLLNLSEDTHVELKMRNRGLIPHLSSLLDRSNQELLILVISFLKKLSIYIENKDDMSRTEVVKKLIRDITCDNEILLNVALRLLLNLSFDPSMRQEMVKMGFLPKLSSLLKDENHRLIVLCILYHISIDRKSRSIFSYADCIPELMRLILECPDELVDPETVALGINLACSPRNVQIMCSGPGLKLLIRRALKSRDSLLFKMIRNISNCPGNVKKLFLPFLSELCQLLKESEDDEDVCVEILGILGNLYLPEVDFHRVVTELDLMPFIMTKFKDANIQDDLLLEMVVLCGTFALDEKCAVLLVEAGLHQILIKILKDKQEDDEMVLQVVYLFYNLILHESAREKVTKQSLAPNYLLELMNDKNKEVRSLCSKTLDIILESDPELALKIKHERFHWHNFQWLEIMMGETLHNEVEDDDQFDPHYLHTTADIYEMQSHLESGGGYQNHHHPGRVDIEYGRNFNPFEDDEEVEEEYRMAQYGAAMRSPDFLNSQASAMFGEMEDMDDLGDGLSSQQYTLLMNSMRDPLAMYSTSIDSNRNLENSLRPHTPFDPMEMYSGNISPTYGHIGGVAGPGSRRGQAGVAVEGRRSGGVEEESRPMMSSSNYTPRPPTNSRTTKSRRR